MTQSSISDTRLVESGATAEDSNGGPPRTGRPSSLLPAGLSLVLLTVITLTVFREQLFDHWTFPWDFLGAYTTTPALVAASVSGGHLLSWSSHVASGFPVGVDPQAGLYFPGWWVLGGLGIPATLRVLTVVQIAHVLFGGAGMLLLARARRLSWSWATLAAVAYLLFGGFYGEAEHADIVRGFAYLPWLLWALTPPSVEGVRWMRLATLPGIAWLIATGGYPAQVVSFGIVGLAYLVIALWPGGRALFRRYRMALLLAVGASAGIVLAVLLPYLHAEQGNELHRVLQPTAAARAGESLAPRDLLGLYLNNFAWVYDGTVTAWAVGIPVLIGLACVRPDTLRRQAPLAACGALALALAMTPKIGFIGNAMASLRPLFPSRFPAADYKAVVAVALILLAADGWRELAVSSRRRPLLRAAVLAVLLVLGALLASTMYAPASREVWLVIVVIVAAFALVAVRLSPRFLVLALVVLVAVDGYREIHDYRLLGHISSWAVPSSEAAQYLGRDGEVRNLPKTLKQAPSTRPARVGPAAPLAGAPTGSNADAVGWVTSKYYLVDYGGTIERSLWQAEHHPALLSLMLAPWRAYTFPCVGAGGCNTVARQLPNPRVWRVSSAVTTLSYGTNSTTYKVNIKRPEVMVENELAVNGWEANSSKVKILSSGYPLRTWRLSPGSYTFTSHYAEPERVPQDAIVIVVVLAWLGCGVLLYRKRVLPAT